MGTVKLEKPEKVIVDALSLTAYLNSKYQFRMNTESVRQEVLLDIENWYMQKRNIHDWGSNESYRKAILQTIANTKLTYYTSLVNQSGLDEKTQRDLILKHKTGKTESEWIASVQ